MVQHGDLKARVNEMKEIENDMKIQRKKTTGTKQKIETINNVQEKEETEKTNENEMNTLETIDIEKKEQNDNELPAEMKEKRKESIILKMKQELKQLDELAKKQTKRPYPNIVQPTKPQRKHPRESSLFEAFETEMIDGFSLLDKQTKRSYVSLDTIDIKSSIPSEIVNMSINVINKLIDSRNITSISITPVQERVDRMLFQRLRSEEIPIIIVPQYYSGAKIGHFIVNVIDRRHEIPAGIVINSLKGWRPRINMIKSLLDSDYNHKHIPVDQQGNTLECGFRCIYNILKIIESFELNQSFEFQHNPSEFTRFQQVIVDSHNDSIEKSQLYIDSFKRKK